MSEEETTTTTIEVGDLTRRHIGKTVAVRMAESYVEAPIVDIEFFHPRSPRLEQDRPDLLENPRIKVEGAVLVTLHVLEGFHRVGFATDDEIELLDEDEVSEDAG